MDKMSMLTPTDPKVFMEEEAKMCYVINDPPKSMYYIYILQSIRDGQFYTGFTDNLQNRIRKHNAGLVVATKHRRPFKLVYFEGGLHKKDALHREIYLKTAWGKRYIKNRLKSYLGSKGPQLDSFASNVAPLDAPKELSNWRR